ncbi:MAG TPA: prenyltransferase/squalene oxidase repeat-containing protein, partial [Pirellulales bacterium]|nr:prenyltransferase/squalene oxidase repeat-containing protein [Pirellulales bacterium]
MVDLDRLSAAYETARCDLLAESAAEGHWIGQLSSSPLATACAISALTIVERHAPCLRGRFADEAREGRLSALIMAGVRWLADHQNPDGGWGESEGCPSDHAATWLVRCAFALTAVPADHPGLLDGADAYLRAQRGLSGLRRRYRRDKIFFAALMTNAALAGLVSWRRVSTAAFERACSAWAPQLLRPRTRPGDLPVLVATGMARFGHRKPWNPLARWVRSRAQPDGLRLIESLQPASGGFLESVPLASFMVM